MKEEDEHHFYLKDLEEWGIFDVNRYKKSELQAMVRDFLSKHLG